MPITLTPSGGFTGNGSSYVLLWSRPPVPQHLHAATVSTQPPAITGTSPVKGYVYVQTVKTTTIANYTLQVQGSLNGVTSSVSIPFAVQ